MHINAHNSIFEPVDIVKLTKMEPHDLIALKWHLDKYLDALNSVIESGYIKQHNNANIPMQSTISEIPVKLESKPKLIKSSGKPRGRKKGSKNKNKVSESESIQIVP